MGYPGRDHRQGSEKNRGAKTFYRKKLGGDDFFNTEIQDFIFKKAIFEDQKVIYVGSSDSSVLIGVRYIKQIH